MINALKNVFEKLRNFDSSADKQASQADINLCSFALMMIIARADNQFDPAEQEAIKEIGVNEYALDLEAIKSILEEAEREADNSTSLYEFTSAINECFSEEEKFRLVRSLWKVAYSDGYLDRFEEHYIRRISELIYLDHNRFIEAKLSVME